MRRDNQRRAAVELVYDVEDVFLEFFGRRQRREQSSNPKVGRGALVFRNERVGCLLDAVVRECVRAVQAEDEAGEDGLPQGRVDIPLDGVVDHVQRGDLGGVPETGQQSQRLLCGSGQAAELCSH